MYCTGERVMSGKLCTGAPTNNCGAALLRTANAYCEGAQARTKSTTPVNPHLVGSEASDAWLLGVADMLADTVEPCCAPGTAAV